MLPVIGNHDVFPRNQAPAEPNAAYDALLELWGDWIGDEEERERFRKGGFQIGASQMTITSDMRRLVNCLYLIVTCFTYTTSYISMD